MMTGQQFTVSGNDAPARLGIAGEQLFAPWLGKQPYDEELDALGAAVSQAEADLAAARSGIPRLLEARRAAEDSGNGSAYSNAVASLAGLPRLVGRLASHRTQVSLSWLARLAALAKAVATEAEQAGAYLTPELKELRREEFAQQSGRVALERGVAAPGGITEAVYAKVRLEAAPFAALQAEAEAILSFAVVRGHLLDTRPGDSKLDLSLSESWKPAVAFAGERGEIETRRVISDGK